MQMQVRTLDGYSAGVEMHQPRPSLGLQPELHNMAKASYEGTPEYEDPSCSTSFARYPRVHLQRLAQV